MRQLDVLADYGDVTTIGFGPAPERAHEHLELPESLTSLPQTAWGVARLVVRRFRSLELAAPAIKAARRKLDGRQFDLVVANEARALPLAHAVAHGAPVWGDMHEWAPAERTHVLSWRLLVAPFMRYVCAVYLPKTAAVTTVSNSVADLYRTQFGIAVELVRNTIARQNLAPTPVDPDHIRLAHSGTAVPGRNIEVLIEGTKAADERFSLHLYLLPARDGGKYLASLRTLAAGSDRIVFHDAVKPHELPATLNRYDLGVFLLPPRTPNHRFMLPNKFFEFVQARLGLIFGPSVETSALIEKHHLGVVTTDFTAESFAKVLDSFTADDVEGFKRNADAAAAALSSAEDEAVQRSIIARLLVPDARKR